MTEKKLISLVVPVYNEEEVLPLFMQRANKVMDGLAEQYEFKVLFVDEGSRDKSWSLIQAVSQADPNGIAASACPATSATRPISPAAMNWPPGTRWSPSTPTCRTRPP